MFSFQQKFKVFLLCLAILVAATSAATVCKCEEKKDTVSKYNVKMKDGNEEIDEEVEIDTEKQTETLSIPKTNSGNAGDVKVVFDFKKNLTMHRLSAAKACFLSDSTEGTPKPDELLKALDEESSSSTPKNVSDSRFDAVSTLTDRSILSDEMADMCAKLPIYRIKKAHTLRVKRYLYCRYGYYCYRSCYWCYPGCRRCCHYICCCY